MENATRAMIMGATLLLGVMLLGLLVWVFRAGSRLGESYDLRQYRNTLAYFNSKLFAYDKNIKIEDDIDPAAYDLADNIFYSEGNTISDVVSAVNLAYDYNKQFNYDNMNNCEMFLCDANGNIRYYLPNSVKLPNGDKIKQNCMYIWSGSHSEAISLNDIMRLHVNEGGELSTDESKPSISEMKILANRQSFYRYYFETIAHVNSKTNRIDRMAFILVEMTGDDQTIKMSNDLKAKFREMEPTFTFSPYTVETLKFNIH